MREFAFVYFDSEGMHRPVAFQSKTEAREFLREKTPLHSYYSTAYYSNPQAPMAEKDWLGADLVFDLDADHIPGSEELNYFEQLKKVKEKCKLLIDDFLIEDFGIKENDMKLFFSGNRGYHVHVRKSEVLDLSKQARREIVDYITGVGLDLSVILPRIEIDKSGGIPINKDKIENKFNRISNKTLKLPPKDAGGWKKKTRRLIINMLKRWERMDKKEVLEEIKEKHRIGEKTANRLYKELYEEEKCKRIIERGVLDFFSEDERMVNLSTFKKIIEGVLKEHNVREIGSKIIGSTDEPVTGDTKRLIRLPSSIHGSSFLVVQEIDLDSLEVFEPLNDAVPNFLTDKEYDIMFEDLPDLESVSVKNKVFEVQEKMTIPEFAIPFFVLKLGAKLL